MSESSSSQSKTFEEAMRELEHIVKQFEEGKFSLDEAISAYERGIELKKHCAAKLQQAKAKIDVVAAETGEILENKVSS